MVCQRFDTAWKICYLNVLGPTSLLLAHDTAAVSLLGFSV